VKYEAKRSEGSFKTKSIPKGEKEKSRANPPGFTFCDQWSDGIPIRPPSGMKRDSLCSLIVAPAFSARND
jgi:hypothetical protein